MSANSQLEVAVAILLCAWRLIHICWLRTAENVHGVGKRWLFVSVTSHKYAVFVGRASARPSDARQTRVILLHHDATCSKRHVQSKVEVVEASKGFSSINHRSLLLWIALRIAIQLCGVFVAVYELQYSPLMLRLQAAKHGMYNQAADEGLCLAEAVSMWRWTVGSVLSLRAFLQHFPLSAQVISSSFSTTVVRHSEYAR